ncbi:MAG: protein kinase [Leptolyngbya sp. Prado105]|jgi:serine/threonine-protein kinase|nr:protein kinase [Leptolyngbya sp. Prado105]
MRTPLPPDSVIADRYAVLRALYFGTAGWVYFAIDQTTKKPYVLEATLAESNEFQELLASIKVRHIAKYEGAIEHSGQVYLVREHFAGRSYAELLEQKKRFSEAEVMQFLKQVLSILRSLHRREIAHQSVSLNSIVQREDGTVTLTEFTQASFSERFDIDLYNLAVMTLALLTGCTLEELYNQGTQRWEWHDRVTVNPRLARVLDRMLSHHQNYPTATAAMQALFARDLTSVIFTFTLTGLASLFALRLVNTLSNPQPAIVAPSISVDAAAPRETYPQRLNRLKVPQQLVSLLAEEASQSAESVLKLLERLSQEARRGMGTYKRVNYDSWLNQRNSNLSRRAIETLTDAQFVALFPDHKGKILNPRTFGQVWYAIAFDQIKQAKPETFSSSISGTLTNGVGKVYRSRFKQGQTVQLSLNAPANQIALWIFSSEATLLKDFQQANWTGKIQQTGFYEIVIAPTTLTEVNYELELEAQ